MYIHIDKEKYDSSVEEIRGRCSNMCSNKISLFHAFQSAGCQKKKKKITIKKTKHRYDASHSIL